jgi:hypothetical protein
MSGVGLAAALTASAALLHPASADPSPVRAKFAEWQCLVDQLGELGEEENPRGMSGEEVEALAVRISVDLNEVLRELVNVPLRDPGDLAMKLVAVTGYGEFDLEEYADRLLADAQAVIAVVS